MVRPRIHLVSFTDQQVAELKKLLHSSSTNKTIKGRIQILLLLDSAHNNKEHPYEVVAKKSGTSLSSVRKVVKEYAAGGLEQALAIHRNPKSDTANKKMDDRAEAKIIEMACGPCPEGRARWTLRLLEERAKVVLDEPVSKDTIRRALKKNELRPHKNTYWCIPKKGNGEFVARMEDVLDVYEREYDPMRPVVCVDELPYEMHGEAREPLPARPGSDRKDDYEYVRCGTCSVFRAIEPLTGSCIAKASEHRTKKDLAAFMKGLSDAYPDAEKIVLKVNWHFRTSDARTKLISLYPKMY